MKISKLKEVVKSILKERSINAISKLQQDNLDKISKALDFYKKNKHTDKREPFIKLLKKLGDEKKKLAKELDMKVSGMYKDAEYKGESVVNEIAKFAGWVAIDHKGKRLEIKKSEAKDLYNAKLFAIKKLKVPKSKESMLVIKPGYNESVVNEAAGKEAMGIAAFTGTRGKAVQKFIDDYNLDAKKLYKFVSKGKLSDRMDFVTAIAGNPGNKYQGKIVGMFGESVNEGEDESVVNEMAMGFDTMTGLFYLKGVPFTKERIKEVVLFMKSSKPKTSSNQFEMTSALIIKDKVNKGEVTIDSKNLKTLIEAFKRYKNLASDKDFN